MVPDYLNEEIRDMKIIIQSFIAIIFTISVINVNAQHRVVKLDISTNLCLENQSHDLKSDLGLQWYQHTCKNNDLNGKNVFSLTTEEEKSKKCYMCIGAGIGAIGGVLIGFNYNNYYKEGDSTETVLAWTLIGTLIGGGLGLAIDIVKGI